MEPVPQPEPFELQRRSGNPSSEQQSNSRKQQQGVIQLSSVMESNKNNATAAQSVPATLTPPAPMPSQVAPQVSDIIIINVLLKTMCITFNFLYVYNIHLYGCVFVPARNEAMETGNTGPPKMQLADISMF